MNINAQYKEIAEAAKAIKNNAAKLRAHGDMEKTLASEAVDTVLMELKHDLTAGLKAVNALIAEFELEAFLRRNGQ